MLKIQENTEKAEYPDSFEVLSPRKQKFLTSKLEGKTDKQAALEAGYSESTSRIAGQRIMDQPDVRLAARDLFRQAIPPALIAKRLKEGLSATHVRFVNRGNRAEKRETPDHAARLAYIKFASEMAGYHSNKEVDPEDQINVIIDM